MVDPTQVEWENHGTDGMSTTLNLICKPDGSFSCESGTFKADYRDESDAALGITQILQHGSTEAQKS